MKKVDHCPPLSGPASDPVLYGVAKGLAHLFPPIVAIPEGKDRPETLTDADRDEAKTDGAAAG